MNQNKLDKDLLLKNPSKTKTECESKNRLGYREALAKSKI